MIFPVSNNELQNLVQHAIFELEEEMDKSWDKLMVLEGKIAKAQQFKSFLLEKGAGKQGDMGWTDVMEAQLVLDIFHAVKRRADHALWNEDLRKYQAQLDAVILESKQQQ